MAEVEQEAQGAAASDTPAAGGGRAERIGRAIAYLLVWLVLAGLVVGGIFAALEIWPDKLTPASDPSWIDNIFASKTVLFGARVVLFSIAVVVLAGAVFTVASIAVRFRTGHWLRRVGPFEVSEQAVSSLQDEVEFQRSLAEAAHDEIEELKERLQDTEELAQHFYNRWQEAIEEDEPAG